MLSQVRCLKGTNSHAAENQLVKRQQHLGSSVSNSRPGLCHLLENKLVAK